MLHAIARAPIGLRLVIVALLAALGFSTLTAITASPDGPARAAAATSAEGVTLTTASGGKTFAGYQAVTIAGNKVYAVCIVPGLPGPLNSAQPQRVVDRLAHYGGNFVPAARILNNDAYQHGKGTVLATVKWGALNRLLDGPAGVQFNRDWSRPGGYAAQLAKVDPSIPDRVQRLIEEARGALPANTFRYDTISLTPAQKGRQDLASGGFSAVASYVCPPECRSEGINTFRARNLTRDTYRLRVVEVGTGRNLVTSPALRYGDVFAAAPRFPDTTRVRVGYEKWTAKGWSPLRYFAEYEVVCPTPPKVEIITVTCCETGTGVVVRAINTTRRTAVYDYNIGGRVFKGTIAPGSNATQGPVSVRASMLVTGKTHVLGPNGPTGVEITASSTVHPGTTRPVVRTTTS